MTTKQTGAEMQAKNNRLILAIDFDGTIVEHGFPAIGEMKEHAKAVINFLYNADCCIIIWTCRDGQYLTDMKKWLTKNGILYHAINENAPEIDFIHSRKVFANYYIDDLNIGGFPGWAKVLDIIMQDEYFKRIEFRRGQP